MIMDKNYKYHMKFIIKSIYPTHLYQMHENQKIKLKSSMVSVSSDDEQYFVRVLALDLIHMNWKMKEQLSNNKRQVEFVVSMSGYQKLNNMNSPQKYFLNIGIVDNDNNMQQRKKEIYRKQIKNINESFVGCDMEVINFQNHNNNEDRREKKWAILIVVRVSNKIIEIETKIRLFNLSISKSTQQKYDISIQQKGQQSYKSYLIMERILSSTLASSTLCQNEIKSFGILQIERGKRKKSAYLSKLQIKMVKNQISLQIVHRNSIRLPKIVSKYCVIPNNYILTDNYINFIICRTPLKLNPYRNCISSEQDDSSSSSSSSSSVIEQNSRQMATKFIITYRYNQKEMLFLKERGFNSIQKITNISRNQIALATRPPEQTTIQIHLLNRKKLETIHVFSTENISLCIAGTNQYEMYVLSWNKVGIIGLDGHLYASNVAIYHNDIKKCIMRLHETKLLIGHSDQIFIIQKSLIDANQTQQYMAQTQNYQIYSAM